MKTGLFLTGNCYQGACYTDYGMGGKDGCVCACVLVSSTSLAVQSHTTWLYFQALMCTKRGKTARRKQRLPPRLNLLTNPKQARWSWKSCLARRTLHPRRRSALQLKRPALLWMLVHRRRALVLQTVVHQKLRKPQKRQRSPRVTHARAASRWTSCWLTGGKIWKRSSGWRRMNSDSQQACHTQQPWLDPACGEELGMGTNHRPPAPV